MLSVKKRRGVFVETIEDITHERFTNEAAAIGYIVAIKIALEHTHLTVVEHDSYAMFTWLASFPGFVVRRFYHVFSEIYTKPQTYIHVGTGG